MRISDWSSDVCSSDLAAGLAAAPHVLRVAREGVGARIEGIEHGHGVLRSPPSSAGLGFSPLSIRRQRRLFIPPGTAPLQNAGGALSIAPGRAKTPPT